MEDTENIGEGLHHCFLCSQVFCLKEMPKDGYKQDNGNCPVCGFYKCPSGHCLCNCTSEAKVAVHNFWKTFCGPCGAKRRKS